MTHTKINAETLVLGYSYLIKKGYIKQDPDLLFKTKPVPIGTVHIWQDGKPHRKTPDGWIEVVEGKVPIGSVNGEIQTLYNKRKFALIKQKLFGDNQPTNKELAQMAGAHKNERVTLTNSEYGIIVKIIHTDYTAKRIVQKDDRQNLFIQNDKIRKYNKDLKNLGLHTLNSQILTGSKYNVKYITANAKRNDVLKFNGYYTWARYGFNGVLPNSNILFKKFKSVSHIMSTVEGRRLWRFLGATFNAKFDLHRDSKSIKMFHKYIEEENERNKKK